MKESNQMNRSTKLETNAHALCLLFLSCVLAVGTVARAQSKPDEKKGGKSTAAAVASTPSQIVLAFYNALRERRFRDAMLMTVLRPPVEALSAAELPEDHTDFE